MLRTRRVAGCWRSAGVVFAGIAFGSFVGALLGVSEFAAAFPLAGRAPAESLSTGYRELVAPFAAAGAVAGLLGGLGALAFAPRLGKGVFHARRFAGCFVLAAVLWGYGLVFIALAPETSHITILVGGLTAAAAGVGTLLFHAPSPGRHRRAEGRSAWGPAALLGAACLLVLGPTLLPSAPRESLGAPSKGGRGPSVVLIVIDTLRADHLPGYGYSRDTAPNLTRLARSGTTFLSAASSSSWTKPAVATLMSGLNPRAHRTTGQHDVLPESLQTLAEIMRDHGHQTLGVTANPLVSKTFGFTQGFDRFEATERASPMRFTTVGRAALRVMERVRANQPEHALEPSAPPAGSQAPPGEPRSAKRVEAAAREGGLSLELLGAGIRTVAATVFGEQVGVLAPADLVTHRAIELVGDDPSPGPLFLYVHYVDPHLPYDPPPPYDLFFSHAVDPPQRDGGVEPTSFARSPEARTKLAAQIDRYDGEIRFVDAEVGRLLEALEARGVLEDALVIVTSDHGEEFLDHGDLKHGNTLYEEVVRVPLIIRWTGGEHEDTTVAARVGLVDLLPTVLDVQGLPAPRGTQGVSLRALPAALPELPHRSYFAELGPTEMVVIGTLKMIGAGGPGGAEQAFDLASDPLERGSGPLPEGDLRVLRHALEELAQGAEGTVPIEQRAAANWERAIEALRSLGDAN